MSIGDPLSGRELAAFVTAVETGTVQGAADALALTQSAATKRVLALERRVGHRLLERTAQGVRSRAFRFEAAAGFRGGFECRRLEVDPSQVDHLVAVVATDHLWVGEVRDAVAAHARCKLQCAPALVRGFGRSRLLGRHVPLTLVSGS